jgi:hypothetical protein
VQPVLGATAVQPVGHLPLERPVLLHVGVEQQQRDAADLRLPDLGDQRAPARQPDAYAQQGAVVLAHLGDGQLVRVEDRVALLLPPLAGQRLDEVAVPVEQPDADDRHAEVAGGLEVVAGEDAEAAGVLREDGGDAELGREVGDRARQRARGRVGLLVPLLVAQVVLEVGDPGGERGEEVGVGGQLGEPGGRHGAQELHGVVPDRVPDTPVDRGEDRPGVGVPAPAQVRRQLLERLERGGQSGADRESADGSHAA